MVHSGVEEPERPVVWYSELAPRRIRQILGDAWLVVWSALWIWVAFRLHDLMMNLAGPGLAISERGNELAASIDSAGENMSAIPLVGNAVAAPFEQMSQTAIAIADAGQTSADAVTVLSRFLAIAVAILGIMTFAMIWIPLRVMFIRRATTARSFLDASADLDLFALRAMARQPLDLIARISDDPAGAWRRSDRRVIDALAALELRDEGLRPPKK